VVTTGNIGEDMVKIRQFYAGVTGKNPHQWTEKSIGITKK
jgi:hypothetical protein